MSRKSTSDSAFTPGKYLVIFLISSLCTFRLFPPWGRPAKRRWNGPPAGHRAGSDQYLRLGRTFLATSAVMIRTGRPFPAYPWFSTSFVPGNSQGGRAILNFLLPRNDITTLCSTMKRYSKSPLTIA
jgi:hypothetical protein